MQRSGGKNPQLERKSKKLKCYESRRKDPDPGMQNWGKKQGNRQNQSGQGDSEPEVHDQILPIPAKVPPEGFDLKNMAEETAKDSRRDDQPDQFLMEEMQLGLIDRNQAEVKG